MHFRFLIKECGIYNFGICDEFLNFRSSIYVIFASCHPNFFRKFKNVDVDARKNVDVKPQELLLLTLMNNFRARASNFRTFTLSSHNKRSAGHQLRHWTLNSEFTSVQRRNWWPADHLFWGECEGTKTWNSLNSLWLHHHCHLQAMA